MFRRALVLFFFLLGVWPNSYSQVDSVTVEKVSIINSKQKVEGLYKTFDEFRRNQPFYTGDFKILKADSSDKVLLNSYRDEILYNPMSKKDKQHSTRRFFGYCKDDTVFIAFWQFHPIVEFAHLSLIKVRELRPSSHYNNPFFHNGMNPHFPNPPTPRPPVRPSFPSRFGPNPEGYEPPEQQVFDRVVNKWFVLDYMTGELYDINTFALLDKFEQWDKELYREYRKTKGKNKLAIQLDFVRRFNERHLIRF